MARHPQIDKEKCIGCGTCAAMCAGVFTLGEDGKAGVTNPEGASEDEVQTAINSCPAGAISWQE